MHVILSSEAMHVIASSETMLIFFAHVDWHGL
jgi:hypothetical protein